MTMQNHLKETVLKTALRHLLLNRNKSPERTARNIQELLEKFNPSAIAPVIDYSKLIAIIKSSSCEECLNWIMNILSELNS